MKTCPADRPFNTTIRDCKPEQAAAQSCEAQGGNPINFVTGDKYLVETDYRGGGAYPLQVLRYYNSHSNREYGGRSEWNTPVAAVPSPPPTVIHYEPKISGVPPRNFLPQNLISAEPQYTGRNSEHWRFSFDSLLLASFSVYDTTYTSIPAVVKIYRPDGKTEFYRYNNGLQIYESDNGFGSSVRRLDAAHPLAPGWQVVSPENEVEIYDIKGKPLMRSLPSGLSHHYFYDTATQTRLVRVEDDFGHSLTLSYADPNHPDSPTTITDPAGNEYRYTYNARGQITQVKYPDLTPGSSTDNPSRSYHYENTTFPDALTGITDENGDRYSTYGYDGQGRAISTQLANGVSHVQVAIDTQNNTRTVTNPLGKQAVYNLSSSGLILSINGLQSNSGLCAAATQSSVYNSSGYKTRTTDWKGHITDYTRDARGLELSRTEAVGTADQRTIATSWHSTFRLPTQIVEPGRITTMTYDDLGHVLTLSETDTTIRNIPYSTNGQNRTTTFTYHAPSTNGAYQVASVDGPRTDVTDVTQYTYTAAGNLSKVTNALGHEIEITSHNAHGLPLTFVDENEVLTTLTYHPRGWLLSSTVEGGSAPDAVTSYAYDAVGQVTRITLPDGSYLDYAYDDAHRLIGVSNNLGEEISYTLDNAGNVTQEQIASASSQIKRTQTRVFDELSRLRTNTGGSNQLLRFSYDTNDNLVLTEADPSGLDQTTGRAFDGLDRVITNTDALDGAADYFYDKRDNLTGVVDERGLLTNYVYDGFDNLVMRDSPDTGVTVYTYDKAGNVTSEKDGRGIQKTFTYDALNRLTLEHYPADSGEDVEYHYDASVAGHGIGRLTSVEDASGSTSFSYDHRGNQLSSTVTVQSATYTTQFAYDLADNLVQTTYPSGRVVNHARDALGRVEGITTRTSSSAPLVDVVSDVEYLPFGPVSSMAYGNDLETTLDYDQDYRMTGIQTVDGNNSNPDIMNLSYNLDAVNNIEEIIDNLDANRSQTFAYDLLNRLTDADGIYGLLYYDYDAVGNRLEESRTAGSNTVTYTYTYYPGSNSIESISDGTNFRFYLYDGNGNVRSDGNNLYRFDSRNRLSEVAP